MMFRSLVFAIAWLAATSCLGQPSVFEALKGKSIVIDYRESFSGPRGSFGVVWRDRIYVSTEGRIFHKVDARSNNPRASGESELVAKGGGGERGTTTWDGTALVRNFRNPRTGNVGRQTIRVSGSGASLSCSVSFKRFNLRQQGMVEHNSCQVVPGNVFAGR
jgi:hypothetical protein